MNLDKPSSKPYSNLLYVIGVVAFSLTFIILWAEAIDTEQETVVKPKTLSVQVLEQCLGNPESSPSACMEAYIKVRTVLYPEANDINPDGTVADPEVKVPTNVYKENVSNHNSGPAKAPVHVPSGNCQSSITYGGFPITSIDQKCQVLRTPEDIRAYGDLLQYRNK